MLDVEAGSGFIKGTASSSSIKSSSSCEVEGGVGGFDSVSSLKTRLREGALDRLEKVLCDIVCSQW